VTLLLPLFSFLLGLILASTSYSSTLKSLLSTCLARGFIPVVIVYNMVYYREGSLSLILLSLISAMLLFALYYLFSKDRLQALCFSYSNIAWLGFPIALALFGPTVGAPMIALYIGGALFGNVWAVTAVSSEPQPINMIFRKVLMSPPVIALSIAAVLRLLQVQHIEQAQWVDHIYKLSKWGMSFAGMCILGMWLRHTKVQFIDLYSSSKIAILKMCCGAVICAVVYWFFPLGDVPHAIGLLFLLFCLRV